MPADRPFGLGGTLAITVVVQDASTGSGGCRDARCPTGRADVVVIGAGHNSLVCAGYLARAGLEVLVLEAEAQPGGNTRTEELTLPGFAHDSCSSAHVLIQNNPLIRDDELGLVVRPRAALPHHRPGRGDAAGRRRRARHAPRPRRHRATRSPAGPTRRRAAFRAMVEEWRGGLAARPRPVELRTSRSPTTTPPARYLALRDAQRLGRRPRALRAPGGPRPSCSGWRWPRSRTRAGPGTGFLPSSLAAGRLDFGWTTPGRRQPGAARRADRASSRSTAGRSSAARPSPAIEAGGGPAYDRVRTVDGRSVRAGRAVVAGGHLARLRRDGRGRRADAGPGPRRATPGVPGSASSPSTPRCAATCRSAPDGRAERGRWARHRRRAWSATSTRHARGELETEDPWLLVVNQTVVDPDRAPDGRRHLQDPHHRAVRAARTAATGRDVKDEYAATLVDLVRRRCTGPGARRHPGDPGGVTRRRRGPQPAEPRRLLPRRRVPARRPGAARLAALRHRRARAVPHRRHRAPGRVGLGSARAQRRPGRPHLARPGPAVGDGSRLGAVHTSCYSRSDDLTGSADGCDGGADVGARLCRDEPAGRDDARRSRPGQHVPPLQREARARRRGPVGGHRGRDGRVLAARGRGFPAGADEAVPLVAAAGHAGMPGGPDDPGPAGRRGCGAHHDRRGSLRHGAGPLGAGDRSGDLGRRAARRASSRPTSPGRWPRSSRAATCSPARRASRGRWTRRSAEPSPCSTPLTAPSTPTTDQPTRRHP